MGRPPLPCLVGPDREDGAKQIVLTRGLMAVIDAADVDAVVAAGKWHAHAGNRTFYARRTYWMDCAWQQVKMHHFLTGWPLVDHINGDGLDNRRSNLRPATRHQNNRNSRTPSSNTSGFKGVSWHKRQGKWHAYITCGRRIYLGSFEDAGEAARAYDAAALDLFGEFACVNFPSELSGRAA